MIYHAETHIDVEWNKAAVEWDGEWIKQREARRRFVGYKKEHPKKTFWQFIDHMNYRILD